MDKMAATLSAVVASAINSSGSVGSKEREYEQKRRERAETRMQELEMRQKLADQRRVIEEEVVGKYQVEIGEASLKLRRVEDELEKQSQLVLTEMAKTAAAEREVVELRRVANESKVVVLYTFDLGFSLNVFFSYQGPWIIC